MSKPASVAEYISSFPKEVRPILQAVRSTVQKAAPNTEEAISYGIPTFKLNGEYVVYFAGAKKHISVYPFSKEMAEAISESAKYDQSGKGTIRFPLDEPMPHRLITKIVKYLLKDRMSKQLEPKATAKKMTTTKSNIAEEILIYNESQQPTDREICTLLAQEIDRNLKGSENKIWHRHPVWFLDGNPIVGYSKLKDSVRLLFWSGQSFDEPGLAVEGTFKAAEARYTDVSEVNKKDLKRWLTKSKEIQWDYKNIVKRKGKLERLK